MRSIPLSSPRLLLARFSITPCGRITPLRAQLLLRHASSTSTSPAARLASQRASSQPSKGYEIAEKLLIYHAGTGRTTFLSMFKVTTLFVTAFFALIAVPAYIKAEKPPADVALVALGGILPIAFVAYTSAPFVTHMHIHLPLSARASRVALERFVRAMPPTTELTVTTMSVIGKPRYSAVKAGDLRPVNRRFGIVNYVRDATAENKARKWYQFGAVEAFHVPPQRALAGSKEQKTSVLRQSAELQASASKKTPVAVPVGKRRDLLEAWIWDAIKEKLEERAAAKAT